MRKSNSKSMSIPHLGPSVLTQVVNRIFICEKGVEVVDVIEKILSL